MLNRSAASGARMNRGECVDATNRRPLNRKQHGRAEVDAWEAYMMWGRDYFGDLHRAGFGEADIARMAPEVWRRHSEKFMVMWRADRTMRAGFPLEQNALATKRTPFHRDRRHKVTPAAVEAFKRMKAARYGSNDGGKPIMRCTMLCGFRRGYFRSMAIATCRSL